MGTRRRAMTSEEHEKKLMSDPEWVAAARRREEEFEERIRKLDDAARPLSEDLRKVGFDVPTAFELNEYSFPDGIDAALPVLLKHVGRPYPPQIRVGIIEAIGWIRAAQAHWPLLCRMYAEESEEPGKDSFANALCRLADASRMDDMLALARDRSNGRSRILLMDYFNRSNDPRGPEFIVDALEDPDLAVNSREIIKTWKRSKRGQKRLAQYADRLKDHGIV